MKIRKAGWEEHKAVCALAKQSKFTKGFAGGGLRYVDSYYAKGWVYAALERNKLVGFACVRHCVNKPHTSVYYIGVEEAQRGKGVGSKLLTVALADSKWRTLELISEKENEEALKFYKRFGFKVVGEGENSAKVPYWRLRYAAG